MKNAARAKDPGMLQIHECSEREAAIAAKKF